MSARRRMVEQARVEIAKADAIQGDEPWAIRALLETIDERDAEIERLTAALAARSPSRTERKQDD